MLGGLLIRGVCHLAISFSRHDSVVHLGPCLDHSLLPSVNQRCVCCFENEAECATGIRGRPCAGNDPHFCESFLAPARGEVGCVNKCVSPCEPSRKLYGSQICPIISRGDRG